MIIFVFGICAILAGTIYFFAMPSSDEAPKSAATATTTADTAAKAANTDTKAADIAPKASDTAPKAGAATKTADTAPKAGAATKTADTAPKAGVDTDTEAGADTDTATATATEAGADTEAGSLVNATSEAQSSNATDSEYVIEQEGSLLEPTYQVLADSSVSGDDSEFESEPIEYVIDKARNKAIDVQTKVQNLRTNKDMDQTLFVQAYNKAQDASKAAKSAVDAKDETSARASANEAINYANQADSLLELLNNGRLLSN